MIDIFEGDYRFLSNFYPIPIVYEEYTYDSVEHAYQATKTFSTYQRSTIRAASTASRAKMLGQHVTLRPDWEEVKIPIMLSLLRKKFAYPKLKTALLATGTHELVEGNWWNDTFWGVCKGKGQNHLGKLLMQVREEIRNAP